MKTKILIVEDEEGIASFLSDGLSEEGYEVETAMDGGKALTVFRDFQPDLVLLDWMLPGIYGIDVCREIRRHDQSTPIIFLTAKDTVQETIEGLRAGANDYVKKPFSFEELLERIKIHFRAVQHDDTMRLADILLNRTTRQVFRDGNDVLLTKREFDLLEFLMRNKGRICTREEIIKEVWDIHFKYDTGVIDVFINALRKKMSIDAAGGVIKTVRGVGYTMVE